MRDYSKYTRFVLLAVLAFTTWLMARISVNYLPMRNDVGFLRIKQQYIGIEHWRMAFFIHVYSSLWVLFAGFTQFSKNLLRKRPKLHRNLGYVYVVDILLVTGPAGLLMGFYANGGLSSRVGFVLLACLWMYFTAMAFYKAKQGEFRQHRWFMMRSYALTLSAITLRLWKYAITNIPGFEPRPMDVYRWVAWMGFVPNLLFVEWMIWKERRKRAMRLKHV